MKIVVGLGNPGRKYRRTRHNVGFEVVAELARRHGAGRPKLKFDAELAEAFVGGRKMLLAAPQSYMNLSGQSVRRIVDFYGTPLHDVLVICDDLNLDVGRIRLRPSGSAGGQKGIRNIIERLGAQDFPRLRIGIGRPPGRMDPADYVLSRFRPDERETIEEVLQRAADGVELWLERGIQTAMNRVNVPPE